MSKHSGLAIDEVIITPIAIIDPPLLNAAGLHAPYALRIIVEIVTNQGIVGISEIPGSSSVKHALEQLRPALKGLDPFELNKLNYLVRQHFGWDTTADRGDNPWDQRTVVHIYSALEVACLDIMGKAIDRPVCDLLGGAVRTEVPFAAYLFYKVKGAGGPLAFDTITGADDWDEARQWEAVDPAGIVDQAKAMCDAFGFQSIKLKGGVFPATEEVAAMQALRDAFGSEMPLRHDPNANWSMESARKHASEMSSILEYWEDPVRGQEQMAALRRDLPIPLATNMCTTSFEEIPSSLKLHSEDIILSDHHFWGGLRACMQLAQIAGPFHRDLSMHSNSHLGISLAAMVHLGACIPNLRYALDTHYPWQKEEVIKGGQWSFTDGNLRVPDAPGLGVEIDQGALARLHLQYLECGLTDRNDEIEMRKIEPGWKFKAVRW